MAGLDANTALLLHMDGTDASTSFPDESDNALTVTAGGDAQVDTAQQKFGTASALFDGTNDWLDVSDAALAVTTGDFTIDFWVRPASVTGTHVLAVLNSTTDWVIRSNSTSLEFGFVGAGTSLEGGTLAIDTWQHIAFVRDGDNVYLFLNGTLLQSSTGFSASFAMDGQVRIGADLAGASDYSGHIDEFRFQNGSAEWTESFTPSTEAYSDIIAVTGDPITAAAPVVDSGALSQIHSLTGDPITAAAALIDTGGAFAFDHGLIGDPIDAAAPVVSFSYVIPLVARVEEVRQPPSPKLSKIRVTAPRLRVLLQETGP